MLCPICKKEISDGAIKCKYCKSMLNNIADNPTDGALDIQAKADALDVSGPLKSDSGDLPHMKNDTSLEWFYEEHGQRKGPISQSEMAEMIKTEKISYGSLVWNKDLPNWTKLENTKLASYLQRVAPPPLSGEYVNNTYMWILAFAPIIGQVIEGIFLSLKYGSYREGNDFLFVTVILNIALSWLDSQSLMKAGHNTDKFKGFVWIVPVYMYQRAKHLKQSQVFLIIWVIAFILSVSL